MVIVPGPFEFLMGSPVAEPGHEADETLHRRRVGRSFAIAAHEVTVDQFDRWRPGFSRTSRHAVNGRCPVNLVTWYEAAEYCNWLSESEGIDSTEWCYLPNPDGKYTQGMKPADDYLSRRGYRLPSEAEWECVARAGAVTSRFYGASEALLSHYAWFTENSRNVRLSEVGVFKPNDLGLFDVLGNVAEWCSERARLSPHVRLDVANEDIRDPLAVRDSDRRALRGWGFNNVAVDLRSANRSSSVPGARSSSYGFRVARTLD